MKDTPGEKRLEAPEPKAHQEAKWIPLPNLPTSHVSGVLHSSEEGCKLGYFRKIVGRLKGIYDREVVLGFWHLNLISPKQIDRT